MERLSSSPHIVNIYAHYGVSLCVDAIRTKVQEFVIWGDGHIKQDKLEETYQHDNDDIVPLNHFTPKEKLQMALDMAQARANLHGYSEGVIVQQAPSMIQSIRNITCDNATDPTCDPYDILLLDLEGGRIPNITQHAWYVTSTHSHQSSISGHQSTSPPQLCPIVNAITKVQIPGCYTPVLCLHTLCILISTTFVQGSYNPC